MVSRTHTAKIRGVHEFHERFQSDHRYDTDTIVELLVEGISFQGRDSQYTNGKDRADGDLLSNGELEIPDGVHW
jgi:hypothetical protein